MASATGGPDEARRLLARLWERVAESAPFRTVPADAVGTGSPANPNLDTSPGLCDLSDLLTRVTSPYQFNPFDWNPLRDLLVDLIDFDVLRELKDAAALCQRHQRHPPAS